MSDSSVSVTPGSGENIATYKITEGGGDKQIQRNSLNDAQGAPLVGKKAAAQSLPVNLATEDLSALSASDPAPGFVDVPTSAGSPLATATRGIAIILAGNLGVKLLDGTDNNAKLIPVTAGQILPLRVVQLTAGNTAGVLGLK